MKSLEGTKDEFIFNQRAVRKLEYEGKRRIFFHPEEEGFAVIVLPKTKTFVFDYYIHGRRRRYTIGQFADVPGLTVEAARNEAKILRVRVNKGEDPQAEKKAKNDAETVNELADLFEETHLPKKRASTAASYMSLLKPIRKELGRLKVVAVLHGDIERLHDKLSKSTPTRANRVVAVLSKMFSIAVKKAMRSDNPVKGIERNQDVKRERYLSSVELVRLADALKKDVDQQTADMVRFLLVTGARRGEVLFATWGQFDLALGKWSKPASHTKQAKIHNVPLSAAAREILSRRTGKRLPGQLVFSDESGLPYKDLPRESWRRILAAAEIEGFRVHDLRHTYASLLASANYSLPMIGALLGHSAPATTARYAHLFDDPLRSATEHVGGIFSGIESGTQAQIKKVRKQ